MSLVNSMYEISFKPFSAAVPTVENRKNCSCIESITARLLFAAQAIVSSIALPIILVVGLISAMINACLCKENEDLKELFKGSLTSIMVIPLSIVGIIAPLSVTECFGDALFGCIECKETNNDHSYGTEEDLYQDQEFIAGEQQDREEFFQLNPDLK